MSINSLSLANTYNRVSVYGPIGEAGTADADKADNLDGQAYIAQAGATDPVRNEKVADDHGSDYGNTRNDGKWHQTTINYYVKKGSGLEKRTETGTIRFAGWDKNFKAKYEIIALGKPFTVKTNSFSSAENMARTSVEKNLGAVEHEKLVRDDLNRNDGNWHATKVHYSSVNSGLFSDKKSETAKIRFAGYDTNLKAQYEINALGKTFTVRTNSFSNAIDTARNFIINQKKNSTNEKLSADSLDRNDGKWHDTIVQYHSDKAGLNSDNKSETVKIRFAGHDANRKAKYEINALGKTFTVRTNSFSNAQDIARKFVEDTNNGDMVSIPPANPRTPAPSAQTIANREKLVPSASNQNDGQWHTQHVDINTRNVNNPAQKLRTGEGKVSIRFKQWNENGKAQYEIKGDGKPVVITTNSYSKATDIAQDLVDKSVIKPLSSKPAVLGPVPDIKSSAFREALKDYPEIYKLVQSGQYIIGISGDAVKGQYGFKAGTLFAIADAATTIKAYEKQGINKTLAALPGTMAKDTLLIPIMNFDLSKVGIEDTRLQALVKGGVGMLTSYGAVYLQQKVRGPIVVPRKDIMHGAAIGNAVTPVLGVLIEKIREQHPEWADRIGKSGSPQPDGWQEFLVQNYPEALAVGLGFSVPLTAADALHEWNQLTTFASLKNLDLKNISGNKEKLNALYSAFKNVEWKNIPGAIRKSFLKGSILKEGAEIFATMTIETLIGKALTDPKLNKDTQFAVGVAKNTVFNGLFTMIRNHRVEFARLQAIKAKKGMATMLAPEIKMGQVLNKKTLATNAGDAVLMEAAFEIVVQMVNIKTIYNNDFSSLSKQDAQEALTAINEVMESPLRWVGRTLNFADIGTIGGTKFNTEMNKIKEAIYNTYPELRPTAKWTSADGKDDSATHRARLGNDYVDITLMSRGDQQNSYRVKAKNRTLYFEADNFQGALNKIGDLVKSKSVVLFGVK